jgi:hypothetical protein
VFGIVQAAERGTIDGLIGGLVFVDDDIGVVDIQQTPLDAQQETAAIYIGVLLLLFIFVSGGGVWFLG